MITVFFSDSDNDKTYEPGDDIDGNKSRKRRLDFDRIMNNIEAFRDEGKIKKHITQTLTS